MTRHSTPSSKSTEASTNRLDEPFISPFQVFSVINRHRILVGVVTAATLFCAGAGIMTLKPYYEATSEIMIGARGMISPSQLQPYAEQAVDLVGLNTQLGVLKSPAIANMVTHSLHLETDPEYQKALAPSGFSKFKQKLGLQRPPAGLTGSQREALTTAVLMGKIRIVNDGRSAIVAIVARSATPELSAKIANAYTAAYFAFERQAKVDSAKHASAMLEEQIAPLRERTLRAEQAVSRYREEHNLDLIGSDDGIADGSDSHIHLPTTSNGAQLSQMSHELGDAEGDLARKQSIAAQAAAAAASGNGAALSAITGSSLIQSLLLQQAQINARISTLSTTALEQNPALVAARSEAARLGAQIGTENQKLLRGLQYEADTARQRVDALKHQIDALQVNATVENRADAHLRQLLSEANAAQTVYRDYLSRLSQISAETTIQQAEARLIDSAIIPLGPSGPPKKQYAVLALLVALGLGVGSALLRDRIRQGVRTLAELQHRTYLAGLGVTPLFSGNLRQQLEESTSLYGQMLNSIQNILTYGHASIHARTLLITSAETDEGKTTLAVSLAACFGTHGKRTLLIDCDPHNPSVLRTLDLKRTGADGLVTNVLPNVDVYVPMQVSGHSALNFHALNEFINTQTGQYDQIIIDTPPVLGFPEAGILANITEGVILAVKWHSTSANVVLEAHHILQTHQARCLGAVLTCVQIESLRDDEGSRMGVYNRSRLAAS